MADILASQSIPQSEEEANMEIAQMFAEMERLNALMRADDIEIARFKQEANAYKDEAERWKAESARQRMEFQQLRQEGQTVAQETRLILDRLKAS